MNCFKDRLDTHLQAEEDKIEAGVFNPLYNLGDLVRTGAESATYANIRGICVMGGSNIDENPDDFTVTYLCEWWTTTEEFCQQWLTHDYICAA